MKQASLLCRHFFKKPINPNNLLFRAVGATFFSYLNYRYFNSFNANGDEKGKKDFGMRPKTPSPNF